MLEQKTTEAFLSFLSFFQDFIYLFIHERQRERQRHREREKQAPCREPEEGHDPRMRHNPKAEGRCPTAKPPGVPSPLLLLTIATHGLARSSGSHTQPRALLLSLDTSYNTLLGIG